MHAASVFHLFLGEEFLQAGDRSWSVNLVGMGRPSIKQDGILRSYTLVVPYHYNLTIGSFSKMRINSEEGFDSPPFESGGYKWKVRIYPNGNKTRNVEGHISCYLILDEDECSTESSSQVTVVFKMFFFNQRTYKYLVLEDAERKEHDLSQVIHDSIGFDHCISLEEFTDASNGYVIADTCLLGAEVHVSKDEILRSYASRPPSHYTLNIDSFSTLAKYSEEGFESALFESGGYKWKLRIYPNGNKTRNVEGHISCYLLLDEDEYSTETSSEVTVAFKMFLFNQRTHEYLVLEDAKKKEVGLCQVMNDSIGFDHCISLEEFTEPSSGYVIADFCVLGAEVHVSKERKRGEHIMLFRLPMMQNQVWKIPKFSGLSAELFLCSETFICGKHKWQIKLYPKGIGSEKDGHLSIYLTCANSLESFLPGCKLLVDFSISILDLIHFNNKKRSQANCRFSPSSLSYGWDEFIALDELSQADKGFLMDDACTLVAQITVRGVGGSLCD